MCARDTGADACVGDSGGPLYDKRNNALVGVTSWGINCGMAEYPGVYSRISPQIDWIKSVVCTDPSLQSMPLWCIDTSLPQPSAAPSEEMIMNSFASGEPTQTPIQSSNGPSGRPSSDCVDDPPGWYDSDGSGYTCTWYAAEDRCDAFGNQSANFGHTAGEVCCVCGGGVSRSATVRPSAVPTRSRIPSPNPSSEPTVVRSSIPSVTKSNSPSSAPSIDCVDDPPGWYDGDGSGYTCPWYAAGDRCDAFGNISSNFGHTASEACCACGGGVSRIDNDRPSAEPTVVRSSTPSIAKSNCVDDPPGWHDGDGTGYTCIWYAAEDTAEDRCNLFGNQAPNFGHTASEACCACGGGVSMFAIDRPSEAPSKTRSNKPSLPPTSKPTIAASVAPTMTSSTGPSVVPSSSPTIAASVAPTMTASIGPSVVPSVSPTIAVSVAPTMTVSGGPSVAPSWSPTIVVSVAPSVKASVEPSVAPSLSPTIAASVAPSVKASIGPSALPSSSPTIAASVSPTMAASGGPSVPPSSSPTIAASVAPSVKASVEPSVPPSSSPTIAASVAPSVKASFEPSIPPSPSPTIAASVVPSVKASVEPSVPPSPSPTIVASVAPSIKASVEPSIDPSQSPNIAASRVRASLEPSVDPSSSPTIVASVVPSIKASLAPSMVPSVSPTIAASVAPTVTVSGDPTVDPSSSPTIAASIPPTMTASRGPSVAPFSSPTISADVAPNVTASIGPSIALSSSPSSSSLIAQTAQCADYPVGWHDSDGASYNCIWYAVGIRCDVYGYALQNDEFTAQEACCVCGGGEVELMDHNYPSPVPTASVSSQPSHTVPQDAESTVPLTECADYPVGWHDSDGASYNCIWYAVGTRCAAYGNMYAHDEFTAQEACCACGGGGDYR